MNDAQTTSAPRAGGCLSDLALDLLVVDRAAARPEHLASCAACSARLASFVDAADRDAVRALAIARRAATVVERPRFALRWPAFAAAGASLAALLVVAIPSGDGASVEAPIVDDSVRSKGVGLEVFVRRDGAVHEALPNERFRAGDALRLRVTAPTRTHVLVVGVTEGGALTVYHPFGGEASAPSDGGRGLLPGSLVLDGARETETLLVVASDAPVRVADLESALAREGLRSGQVDAARLRALDVPGDKATFVVRRE